MIYVISGEESFLCNQQLNKILKDESIDLSFSDLGIYDCLETSIINIVDEAEMIPFLNDKRCIIIKNPYFLAPGKKKDDNNIDEREEDLIVLEKYLNNPNPLTVMIFMSNYPKLAENKKMTKLLRKKARFFEFGLLNDMDIKKIVESTLKENNIRLDQKCMNLLLDSLPTELESVYNELNKIILFGPEISIDDIKKLIIKPIEDDTFEMVNAVLKRDLRKTLLIWQDLISLNKEPIQLVALLASQFRFMYQVKVLIKQRFSQYDIATKLNVKPYRVQVTAGLCRNHSEERILDILNRLCELDYELKSGSIDKKLSFELFLLRLESGEINGIN